MSALPQASGIAFAIVKYAGAVYVLYLAWATPGDTDALSAEQNPAARSARSVIEAGITSTCSTPSSRSSSSPSFPSSSPPATALWRR